MISLVKLVKLRVIKRRYRMRQKLQLLYNRARQNVVTNELIDIIGGANAIGGEN